MKYAFFTIDGHGLPLAYRLQQDGEEVYVGFVGSFEEIKVKHDEDAEARKRRLGLFDGMFKNKMDSHKLMRMLSKEKKNTDDWFTFVDFNFLHPVADKLRAWGFHGLQPEEIDEELEKDRKKAKDLVKKKFSKLIIGEYSEFSKIAEAIKFLSENSETLYVLKGYNEGSRTIVPRTEDVEINRKFLVNSLNRWRKEYEKDGFILEELIPDLVEFTPEAIAYDGKVLGVSIDIEHKLLGQRSGFQTGCTMDMVYWIDKESKCYEWFLKPLESMMLRKGEMTIWDASVLYSPSRKQYFFGEFCFNRPGYNALFTEVCTQGSAKKYFERISAKKSLYSENREISKKFGTSIRIFNLLLDDSKSGLKSGGDLIVVNEENPDIWLWDIQRIKNSDMGLKDADKEASELYTVGYDKNTMIVTGAGDTIEKAIDKAFKNLQEVNYDIGYHLEKHDFMDEKYKQSIYSRYKFLEELGITD